MASFRKLKGLLGQDVSALASPSRLKAALSDTPEEVQVQLWEAVAALDVVAVQRAVKAGASPSQCSAQGMSALHVAARSGNVALVSALLVSAQARSLALDEPSAQGFSALSEASAAGCSGCVQALIEAGANPRLIGPRGVTALHRAAAQDNAEVLRVLSKAGASWQAVDIDGATPLDVLAQHRPHAVNAWRRRAQESGSS